MVLIIRFWLLQALQAAARGGKWTPDVSLLMNAPLKLFDLSLACPAIVFLLFSYAAGLGVANVKSPVQLDLLAGRRTSVEWTLEELVDTGRRYGVTMPVCSLLVAHIRSTEAAGAGARGMGGGGVSPQVLATIESLVFKSTPATVIEGRYWAMRICTVASILFVFYYLFIYDY